jgi:hypothetical protein
MKNLAIKQASRCSRSQMAAASWPHHPAGLQLRITLDRHAGGINIASSNASRPSFAPVGWTVTSSTRVTARAPSGQGANDVCGANHCPARFTRYVLEQTGQSKKGARLNFPYQKGKLSLAPFCFSRRGRDCAEQRPARTRCLLEHSLGTWRQVLLGEYVRWPWPVAELERSRDLVDRTR